jgi:hypothetical protein
MGIFGAQQGHGPSRLSNIRVTASSQGRCVPVVMGTGRIHQSLLWTDGLVSWKFDGGKGGGKGVSEYVYASDVIAALCNGGSIKSIGSVWDGQSWLSANSNNDSVSIAQVYAPSNAALLVADNGVSFATTYSGSYTDYGAPAATVLSGTDYAPLTLVPYGTTLTTGKYSVNSASIGTFAVTACGNASAGSTVYTGTFTGGTSPYGSGAANGYVGFRFIITGFANALNNGTFLCTASDAASLTLSNTNGVMQSATATAVETGNTYHFATADVGKTAQINYQLSVQELRSQETDVIPSGLELTVGGSFTPTTDLSVIWYDTSGTPPANDLQKLTNVSPSSPSATGQYSFTTPGDGSTGGATYHFYSGDVGKEVLITWKYENLSAAPSNVPNLLKFELFGGGLGQSIWPFILSGGKVTIGTNDGGQAPHEPAFPGAALGYSNTAYLAYGPMSLGMAGEIPDINVEVFTADAFGGNVVDCNPIQCVFQVLTNNVWGLGTGPVPFPTSAIDNGASGTWGGAVGTPGTRQVGSTAWNWFAANNFFISPVIDSQDSAASLIGKWLEAGQVKAFMSEGLLKLVALGTQSCAANGCTWVAPPSAVASLDDTCFVKKEGEAPVKISRSDYQDGWNQVQVDFSNRLSQYSNELLQESDQASINRWGQRTEGSQSLDFVCTLPAALFSANMRLKRGMNIRNSYKFTLPFTYSYLEPMDLVNITTSSVWAAGLNNVNLGITNLAVRITKIVDDPITGLEIEAEDSLFYAALPSLFNKDLSSGVNIIDVYAPPGSSEVVMFEATSRLTGQVGNQIWIGACGTSADYGSTNIWVSQDGIKYLQIGTIQQAARLGTLDTTFGSGSDPDENNELIVDMADNSAALDAGSSTDADSNVTMCFVDGEIIAYSSCAISGQGQYTMNLGAPSVAGYIRRGQMGSTINSHASGTLFLRLDNSIFKWTYDPNFAGKTLYFKFQAVNRFGNTAQDLSTLTAVTFVVPGQNPGTIDASSGLVLANNFDRGAGPLGWAPVITTV